MLRKTALRDQEICHGTHGTVPHSYTSETGRSEKKDIAGSPESHKSFVPIGDEDKNITPLFCYAQNVEI